MKFVDLTQEIHFHRDEFNRAISEVLDSGQFIGGPQVQSFEKEFADYMTESYCVSVSSGTDALLVSLMALDIGPGKKVATTPFTFFATAGSVVRLGAGLEFVDVDAETYCPALENYPGDVDAIVAVSLFGYPAPFPKGPSAPFVVEDAAQSTGTGSQGAHLTATSFFPAKNLGALGDGGAVVTSDSGLADRVRILARHGANPKYVHREIGGNFRLDALQAAILRIKLKHLDDKLRRRRTLAAEYRDSLAPLVDSGRISVPRHHDAHAYNQFVISSNERNALQAFLKAKGIPTQIYYPSPLHLQECFEGQGWKKGQFPVAEKLCERVLALPIHPYLSKGEQEQIIDALLQWGKS